MLISSGRFIVAVALGASIAFTNGASATTYNLNADWSNTNNPNGPWTLRGDSTTLNDPVIFPSGQPGWAPPPTIPISLSNYLPRWFKAESVFVSGADWAIGDVVVYTPDGPTSAQQSPFFTANILFKSPEAGLADISGVLWNAINDSASPQAWSLYINNVLQTSGALAGVQRANPTTFNIDDTFLNAGDEIALLIFRTGDLGNFVGNNLIVDLTPVPLPAALPLFGIGLAGLWLIGRWKRRKAVAA